MKKWLYSIGIFLLLSGCLISGCVQKTKAPNADEVIQVANDDAAMNAALAKGNATQSQFISALQNKKASQSGFAIYAKFNESGQVEYLWLDSISYDGKNFSGIVNNTPGFLKKVKLNDKVKVAPENVKDWMYIENKKLMGGYTMRVLYDQMSQSEREAWDKERDWNFD